MVHQRIIFHPPGWSGKVYREFTRVGATEVLIKMRYIGETERQLRERLNDHKKYIKSIIPTQSTGEHFNSSGHSLHNITITILEKVKSQDKNYRLEREKFYIKKFDTYNNGLNRKP